jgi:HD-like signal output (HDOD) protein
MEDNKHKSDAELIEELQGLVAKIPTLAPKLSAIQDATSEENIDSSDKVSTEDDNRVTH